MINIPTSIRSRVRVYETDETVEIVVDRAYVLPFFGPDRHHSAQQAIALAVHLAEIEKEKERAAKEEKTLTAASRLTRFLNNKKKPMATKLRVIK